MSECEVEQQRYCGDKFDAISKAMNDNHISLITMLNEYQTKLLTQVTEQGTILSRVESQTIKTNGRVTVLEGANQRSVGRGQLILGIIGSGAFVGTIFSIITHFWK